MAWNKLLAMSFAAMSLAGCAQLSNSVCPMLCPPPPACCADCNGDRGVTIDELTKQARIHQQLAPLSECPAADCDGDGRVDQADLAAGAQAAQGGCPR